MKIFKLFKIAILIFFTLGISKLEGGEISSLKYVPYILYSLSFLIVCGFAFWAIKIKKIKLFMLPFMAFLMLTGTAFAQQTPEIYEDKVYFNNITDATAAGAEICNAIEGNQEFDLKILKKASGVLDFFNRYGGGSEGGLFGGESSATRCASQYIEDANAILKSQKATCSPTSAILKNIATKNKCWPCDVTSTIIAAIQKISIRSYTKINDGAKLLLASIYLMWLAITILVSFAKFGFEKFAEFFTKVLNQTIMVIIIAVILHMPLVQFYKATISPFITYSAALGMRFSEIAQESMGGSNNLYYKIIKAIGISASSKCHYCDDMKRAVNKEVSTGQFIDSASINGILCVTCSTYRQAAPMISLGQVMICLGRSTPQSLGQLPILSRISQFSGPNVSLSLTGYTLVITFSIFTFLVGYFIMTSVFKLGVVFVLMPLFLVAFAFKVSRSYATKAWQLIVFAMGTILIVSILSTMMIIGFSILMPEASVAGFIQLFFSSDASMMTDVMAGSNLVEKLQNVSGAGDVAQQVLGNVVDDHTFLRVLTMTAFSYICISVLCGASELAEQITNCWSLNTNDTQNLSQSLVSATQKSSKAAKAALGATGLLAGKALNVMKNDGSGGTQYSADELMKEANANLQKYRQGGDPEAQAQNANNPKGKLPGAFDDAGSTSEKPAEKDAHRKRWHDNLKA